MPKDKETTNHPCHLLSLPFAKRFWCRHCMTVFEDAITRWRHSRSCRYRSVNNFMRRRELEAKALQNTVSINPVEVRLGQSIQMSDLASSGAHQNVPIQEFTNGNELQPTMDTFTCFICHQQFASMEEMRAHVKYPCSSSRIITSHVPHPKHSMPAFMDDLPPGGRRWQPTPQQPHEIPEPSAFVQAHSHPQQVEAIPALGIKSEQPAMVSSVMVSGSMDSDVSKSSENVTPTNIYVNDQGETVIEVENLDLNSEGGELSLAHLLTQLSRQGIVFDKTQSSQLQPRHEANSASVYSPSLQGVAVLDGVVAREDEEQPTAEDAANTLAQLAGYRSFRSGQSSTYNSFPARTETHNWEQTPQIKSETHNWEQTPQIKSDDGCSYSHSIAMASPQFLGSSHPHTNVKLETGSNHCQTDVVMSTATHLQNVLASNSRQNEDRKVESSPNDTYYDMAFVNSQENHIHAQIHLGTDQSVDEEAVGEIVVEENATPVGLHDSRETVQNSSNILEIQEEHNSLIINECTDVKEEGQAGDCLNPMMDCEFKNDIVNSVEQAQTSDTGIAASENMFGSDTDGVAGEEFTVQTVTLQEIVDSESAALSFGEEKASASASVLHAIGCAESSDTNCSTPVVDNPPTSLYQGSQELSTSVVEIPTSDHRAEEETISEDNQSTMFMISSSASDLTANPPAVYVVTPSGIQSVGINLDSVNTV